jgi:hypothetical protein
MCMGGGGSPKVETPKPPPLPPPLPPPPAPTPAPPPPQKLQEPDAKPDIKIGASKAATSRKSRTTGDTGRATSSLTIGNSQGLTL